MRAVIFKYWRFKKMIYDMFFFYGDDIPIPNPCFILAWMLVFFC